MADGTGIEWTHRAGTKGETWNPIVGCSIHSPGCTFCYAMTMASRIEAIDTAAGRTGHYAGTTRKVKGKAVWTGKIGISPRRILTAPPVRVVYDRDRDDPDWRRCDVVAAETPKGQWLNLAGGQGFHGERLVRVVPATKKAAGRLLDGVEHIGFPEIREVPFG
jgi:hypothetical protein